MNGSRNENVEKHTQQRFCGQLLRVSAVGPNDEEKNETDVDPIQVFQAFGPLCAGKKPPVASAFLCSWSNARLIIRMQQLGTRKNNIMPAFLCALYVLKDVIEAAAQELLRLTPQAQRPGCFTLIQSITQITKTNQTLNRIDSHLLICAEEQLGSTMKTQRRSSAALHHVAEASGCM